MNSHHEDEQLDALLHGWAGSVESPGRISALCNRIVSAADVGNVTDTAADVGHARTSGRWSSRLATAVVLLLVVGLGAFWHGVSNIHSPSASNDPPPALAWLNEDQVHDKSVLLDEAAALFDDRLQWMAERPGRVLFGIAEPDQATATGPPLAVRIIVERRLVGRQQWDLAWTMDVLSHSEQLVEVPPEQADGHELRLWAWQMPDGLIAVDSELQLAGRDKLQVFTSELQTAGQPVNVFNTTTSGIEYRMYQTVTVLSDQVAS